MRRTARFGTCSIKVGDKWSFLIFAVLEEGPKRFNEVKRLVGDISHRVLARKLRELERDGYVTRTVHPVRPPKVVCELTPLGRSIPETDQAVLEVDARCGPGNQARA